jgi:hypothetical protein
VRILSAVVKQSENGKAPSVKFETVVTGGAHKGMNVRLSLYTDRSKPFVNQLWKAALLSVGVNPATLESGAFKAGPDTFIGKDAYINVRDAEEGEDENGKKKLQDRKFITKGDYEALIGAATGTGTGSNGAMMTPQPGGNGLSALGQQTIQNL